MLPSASWMKVTTAFEEQLRAAIGIVDEDDDLSNDKLRADVIIVDEDGESVLKKQLHAIVGIVNDEYKAVPKDKSAQSSAS